MCIWKKYSTEQRERYIHFLQVWGSLSNLFRQKQGDLIPYLDSKFQETVFAKIFESQTVDICNTPHDVMSIIGGNRIGIGLKTWMHSRASFQKVMQLKHYQAELRKFTTSPDNKEFLAQRISEIKNEKMRADYARLGLSKDSNIYHYITRDAGKLIIQECAYPLIDVDHLTNISYTNSSISWSDRNKEYRFTFADFQILQKFDQARDDTFVLGEIPIDIIEDPFSFLLEGYAKLHPDSIVDPPKKVVEVYLPLYSYSSKEVEEKSGLNAWNASPKNKGSNTLRPLNEIYIPIPREFHERFPAFFTNDIRKFERERSNCRTNDEVAPQLRFHLQLPNGKLIPALITQSGMKALQSGSNTERDADGNLYGQSALGQWLLIDVLGLSERKLVTRDWLQEKGTDSVRLWRDDDDYSVINIDFAPINSFELFMDSEQEPVE